jgi:hypothetical protein
MKQIHVYLFAIGCLSILPILVFLSLYFYKRRQVSYNFKRNIHYKIDSIKPIDIHFNSYYFAGASGNDFYLGNSTAPFHLLKINSSSTDTLSVKIKANKTDVKLNGLYTVYTDSIHFYLFNGFERSILKGDISNWEATPYPIFTPYFSLVIPLSYQSMVFRMVSTKTGNNSLRKESLPAKTIENESVLEKQVDGLFCTDGMLDYNKHICKIIYTYYYRNQILLLDTNLKLVTKIKTIDPVDSAKFKVAPINSKNSITFSSPPLVVNAKTSTWKKYLFVQSKLMGKQEDETLFKTSTVIDIYDLEKNTYQYSIYLPNYDNYPIRQFKVVNGYIYSLADRYLIRYALQLP